MKGRTPIGLLPETNIKNPEQDITIIVVFIIADKQGKVLRAVAGAQGTNTSNESYLRLAQQAALRSKWSAKPDAPEEQRGTITYKIYRQH